MVLAYTIKAGSDKLAPVNNVNCSKKIAGDKHSSGPLHKTFFQHNLHPYRRDPGQHLRQCADSVIFYAAKSFYAMGLHHPLDGITNPKYKLLHFFTTKIKFCKEKKALAFNCDRCCHLALCLQLILFHWPQLLFLRVGGKQPI